MVDPDRSPRSSWGPLLRGWPRATVGALAAIGVGLLLSEAIAFGFAVAGGSPGSPASIAQVGPLLFYAFHHVPLVFDAALRRPSAQPVSLTLTVATAPMLGTLALGAALFVAGRLGARRAGPRVGSLLAAGAEGTKVAVPYAVLCGIGGLVARITLTPPGSSGTLLAGSFSVGPAVWLAFVWPAVVAAIAGFLGGVAAWRSDAAPAHRTGGFDAPAGASSDGAPASGRERWARVAIIGGSAMAGLALTLSFAGLLVLAAIDTGSTRGYFDATFGRGPARGVAAVGLTALEVPNMAAWVLYPAMGSCVDLATTSRIAPGSLTARSGGAATCVLSYRALPARALFADPGAIDRLITTGSAAGPGAPAGYLLFLLAPGIAVLAGGWGAARRSGAVGPARSAAAGALAGVVFAAWSIPIVVLARSAAAIAGAGSAGGGGSVGYSIGPAVLLSVGVAAAWGVIGGSAGGALRGWSVARRPAAVRERVFSERSEPPSPPLDAGGSQPTGAGP